jgi:5-(carboxyamino)imidazole ribonucleotide synthase
LSAILPGGTLGILGGGQLGRMTAMDARSLGYDIHALDPDPVAPIRPVVDVCLTAGFDDVRAAGELARACDVVTIEIEKVAVASLEEAARHAPVRPGPEVVALIQDRARQKSWLEKHGFPVGPWREAATAAEIAAAATALGGPCFVKVCFGGYDGRGQAQIAGPADATSAFTALGEQRCVVERELDLEAELSVLVARRPSGEVAVYPPALNHHERRALAWSVLPGPIPETVAARAREMAAAIASQLQAEGLLVCELFLTRGGDLYVNELAPRPHNTFHSTEVACATSQFEQLVRAICDLPLGSTELVRPAAIVNLFGDLWLQDRAPDFQAALSIPGVRLHLYGKRVPRAARKMGHLSAIGSTAAEAVERVREAERRLGVKPTV